MGKYKKETPGLVAEWISGRLAPCTAADAERLSGYPAGSQFHLTPVTRRQHPLKSKYWAILGFLVRSGLHNGSVESLHDAVKKGTGRYTVEVVDGTPTLVTESMSRWDDAEIDAYYTEAMAWLSGTLGCDVVQAWEESRK